MCPRTKQSIQIVNRSAECSSRKSFAVCLRPHSRPDGKLKTSSPTRSRALHAHHCRHHLGRNRASVRCCLFAGSKAFHVGHCAPGRWSLVWHWRGRPNQARLAGIHRIVVKAVRNANLRLLIQIRLHAVKRVVRALLHFHGIHRMAVKLRVHLLGQDLGRLRGKLGRINGPHSLVRDGIRRSRMRASGHVFAHDSVHVAVGC